MQVKLLAMSFLVLALCGPQSAQGQFFNAIANLFRPIGNLFRPRFRDDGTRSPQATGRDEINPSDCGRNTDTGTGKLCFPDGILCQNSKDCSAYQVLFKSKLQLVAVEYSKFASKP